MKYLFIIFLSITFLNSCGEKIDLIETKCSPECNYWEDCDAGECKLKENMCVNSYECNSDEICDMSSHYCVYACNGISCSNHGTCGVTNHIASCICNNGYFANGLTCVLPIVENCSNGMCNIPAGSFMMGSESGETNEKPVHQVTLSAYKIDQYEVTVSQFQACVNAGSCTSGNYVVYNSSDNNWKYCNYNRSGFGNHPMNCVNWNGAVEYCQWKGKRLPTEAEWEYAARGNDGRIYPWGDQTPTCNYAVMNDGGGAGCGQNRTWEIGSKPAGKSPFGLYDMSGNVWEWVNDWYSETYYSSSPTNNPQGPGTGSSRVLRGGGWNNDDNNLRSPYRIYFTLSHFYFIYGFRCAESQ